LNRSSKAGTSRVSELLNACVVAEDSDFSVRVLPEERGADVSAEHHPQALGGGVKEGLGKAVRPPPRRLGFCVGDELDQVVGMSGKPSYRQIGPGRAGELVDED
jgi:hypothetical protein